MQYICLECGYNMVGYYPDVCPFCGTRNHNFISISEAEKKFKVKKKHITKEIIQLNSYPSLGYEHSSFTFEADGKKIWIDCPSSYDKSAPKSDIILFTHNHFLGCSNLYSEFHSSQIFIHKLDSEHELCKNFSFDKTFDQNFKIGNLEIYHIGGHTPGFSFYIYRNTIFICDYVFLKKDQLEFNPFGNQEETLKGAIRMQKILDSNTNELDLVCAYNYVSEYKDWKKKFDTLLSTH